MTIRVYVQELCSSFCSFADIFPGVVLYFSYVMFYQCILLVWLLLVLPSGNHNFCFEIPEAILDELFCEGWSLKKISANSAGPGHMGSNRVIGRCFFRPPTLTSDIFTATWLKSMFSTSFKRSISYLFGDANPKLLKDF